MPLLPLHRLPVTLPGPWPACAQGALRQGSAWLHTGLVREGDAGGDLLALPGGPRLEARWEGGRWVSRLEGRHVEGSPWEALAAAVEAQGIPWVGAATFELCASEAGLPFQPPGEGSLGLRWQGAPHMLSVRGGQAELWSWSGAPSGVEEAGLGAACALAKARGGLRPRWGRSQHREAVQEIQRRILEGDFYVANLCAPLEGPFEGDPVTLALAAFRRGRPPYGAFLPLGEGHLLSLSMERLLGRRGDRLWTEPIKGSAPLTGRLGEDEAAARSLAADPKERAEHTMIVDLLRNDLGRVARAGSVRVERLMAVEPYPTVQHLVSRISAALRPGTGLPDLLRAVLPGGSVTGAPKHAVCAHLARSEAGPRGFYCGALGWIAPDGDLDLCLPIRTAHLEPGRIRYWTGGGITRRSDPDREWEELLLKAKVLEGLLDLPSPQ